eukprot:TRINITY_DN39843_c0_g1_i1.p1 TRINITY_DN39843_c0_g1~~TRINITY_DN39843_c0_g1_i1.p1  ORF type:complete len:167 (-),score=51.63 TRINITY_DN39843_c0_g1_i1:97-597(-)
MLRSLVGSEMCIRDRSQMARYSLSRELDKHAMDVRAVAAGPDGSIMTASRDDMVRVWSPAAEEDEQPAMELVGHTHFIYSIMVSQGGKVISGDGDGKVIVWDLEKGEVGTVLAGHNDASTQKRAVTSLAMANERLITCGWDFSVRVWADTECVAVHKGHTLSLIHI